ncbi:hypothetical protein PCC7418_1744 [Halothece sp. PCC 7418]|nr:hypothetical protein PCC7418_1744 [Halothece sp. PCC 7418]
MFLISCSFLQFHDPVATKILEQTTLVSHRSYDKSVPSTDNRRYAR